MGVSAGAQIKKRHYWPEHVSGEIIYRHSETKEVGKTDSLLGFLEDVPYDIFFCMKELEYGMKMMDIYGGLTINDGQRNC